MSEEEVKVPEPELSAQEMVIQEMNSDTGDAVEKEKTPEIKPEVEPETQTELGPDPKEKDADVLNVTEEEIESVLTERKTGVQKRIDKLVAERNSAKDEVENLRKRIEAIESAKQEKETVDESKPKYSREDLAKAKSKAIEEGDMALLADVFDHEILWARYEAKQEMEAPIKESNNLKKKAEERYREFANTYQYNDDPQLSLLNNDSLIYKVMNKLYTEEPEKYNAFGELSYVMQANDAKDLILQARYNKATNTKTRKLEKEIVNEKLKTQLGSGVSSGSAVSEEKVKKYKTPLDEIFSERQKIQNATMGIS